MCPMTWATGGKKDGIGRERVGLHSQSEESPSISWAEVDILSPITFSDFPLLARSWTPPQTDGNHSSSRLLGVTPSGGLHENLGGGIPGLGADGVCRLDGKGACVLLPPVDLPGASQKNARNPGVAGALEQIMDSNQIVGEEETLKIGIIGGCGQVD